MKADDIKVIGITGGIGSGKSTFADFIRQEGYPVIDMDSRAKELMNTSAEVQKKIIAAFGEDAYQNGVLNKDFLAQKVFATKNDGDSLQKLNSIVHPAAIDDKIKEIVKNTYSLNSALFCINQKNGRAMVSLGRAWLRRHCFSFEPSSASTHLIQKTRPKSVKRSSPKMEGCSQPKHASWIVARCGS